MDNETLMGLDPSASIFNNYKNKYASLNGVLYQNNNWEFPNGMKITGINVASLDPSIFEMSQVNLYIYLSNKFFIHNENTYNKEIDSIFELFSQLIITEEEVAALKSFTFDFWLRLQLYSNEQILANDEEFIKELITRRKVITAAYKSASEAASIIIETYNENVIQVTQTQPEVTPTYEQPIEETQDTSVGQGMKLVRKNPNSEYEFPTILDDDSNRLGIAGFTSVLLILGVTLAVGTYLAITLLR